MGGSSATTSSGQGKDRDTKTLEATPFRARVIRSPGPRRRRSAWSKPSSRAETASSSRAKEREVQRHIKNENFHIITRHHQRITCGGGFLRTTCSLIPFAGT